MKLWNQTAKIKKLSNRQSNLMLVSINQLKMKVKKSQVKTLEIGLMMKNRLILRKSVNQKPRIYRERRLHHRSLNIKHKLKKSKRESKKLLKPRDLCMSKLILPVNSPKFKYLMITLATCSKTIYHTMRMSIPNSTKCNY